MFFMVTSTIRFCVLQRFRDLQPSDFEHFNVLGDFNHQILRTSRFYATSTIRFCVLQGFMRLQPSDFEPYFKVLPDFAYFKVLCEFNHQILGSSRFYDTSTIRFFVLQCIRQLQPSDFEPFNVLATSTIRF